MPRVKPENRKRARRPKTRGGCVTCKVRRVKCDETRPSCGRCTSTGRTCDGYDHHANASLAVASPPVKVPSVFKCSREHRSYAFFLERTSVQLAGFSKDQFWNGILLQAVHQDAALRYAVVALASLHEGFEKTGEAERLHDDFALQKYNLAISQHLESLAQPTTDRGKIESYVASCMVFMCIELIQGHYISALSLVKGAVKLFYENSVDSSGGSAWPVDVFESMLCRLQSQAVDLLSPDVVGDTVLPRPEYGLKSHIPIQFRSISEAKECLEYYVHLATLSRPQRCISDGNNAQVYMGILMSFRSAFDKMMEVVGPNLSDQEIRGANVLNVWTAMMKIGIPVGVRMNGRPDDQTVWDLYQDQSAEVVRLAELVLDDPEATQLADDEVSHFFTLDFGIVGPLYDTARLCRNPKTRRKAIYLLRRHPRREGLWDSLLAARSAEKQMELEEAAVPLVEVAEDIPGWARISTALPDFKPGERRASVVFTRQQPLDGTKPAQYHEILEW